jgi:hypothetical protein
LSTSDEPVRLSSVSDSSDRIPHSPIPPPSPLGPPHGRTASGRLAASTTIPRRHPRHARSAVSGVGIRRATLRSHGTSRKGAVTKAETGLARGHASVRRVKTEDPEVGTIRQSCAAAVMWEDCAGRDSWEKHSLSLSRTTDVFRVVII